jgi:hypothetical protein
VGHNVVVVEKEKGVEVTGGVVGSVGSVDYCLPLLVIF